MKYRLAGIVAALALLAAGQTVQRKSWSAPRTPDGKPDLQGIWTNNVSTPLERPRELAGKEFFTDQEALAYPEEISKRPDSNGDSVADPVVWWEKSESRLVTTHRTSLIVDPPDGRLPALTPAAQKIMAEIRAETRKHPDSSPEDFGLQSRCIVNPAG